MWPEPMHHAHHDNGHGLFSRFSAHDPTGLYSRFRAGLIAESFLGPRSEKGTEGETLRRPAVLYEAASIVLSELRKHCQQIWNVSILEYLAVAHS